MGGQRLDCRIRRAPSITNANARHHPAAKSDPTANSETDTDPDSGGASHAGANVNPRHRTDRPGDG